MTPEMIAAQLGQTGLCICPDYLSPSFLQALRADWASLRAAGQMQRAGVGQGDQREIKDRVRSDQIHWLERTTSQPAQTLLWKKLDLLQQGFNRGLFLGLDGFDGHYAIYSPGGFYRRHLDRDSGSENGRIVSLILYLNENWQKTDGGELRIHAKDGSHRDVAPRGGALVCFLSEESEHEVLPSTRDRVSFTGWFKRRG
jgi:SM-20-related protein